MGGVYVEEIKKKQWEEDELYQQLKALSVLKRQQRTIEERLLQVLGKVTQRKWMHERLKDQTKHEKIINHLIVNNLNRSMEMDSIKSKESINHSIAHELENRLEGVEQNMRLMNQMMLALDDFYLYKIINSMLHDEYIYQSRLIKMINER